MTEKKIWARILTLLYLNEDPMTINEIVKCTDLTRNQVRKCMPLLISYNYVRRQLIENPAPKGEKLKWSIKEHQKNMAYKYLSARGYL